MKSQLVSSVYSLLNNPQTIRLVVIVVAICLVLAALAIPALTTFASGLSGSGSH